ncbi:MAG TPA: hypothetical protein VG889_05650 [Rhizomicrobium sp.]|nr:hypothetical protein [Rhizomicrobium sp.]
MKSYSLALFLAASLSASLLDAATAQPARPQPVVTPPAWSQKGPENFYVIVKRKDAEFAALRKKLGEKRFEREEGTGFDAYMEWKTYWAPKVCPHGDLYAVQRAMVAMRRDLNPSLPATQSGNCTGWHELGQFDMPQNPTFQAGVGRADWITIDPNNSNRIFTGSSAGGLWISTDGTASWQNGNSDFFLPNLAVADLQLDPTNSNTWFVATGDGDGYGDNGWGISYGVLRTTDNGATFQNIGIDASAWWGYQIKKLAVDPGNPNTIIAATSFGIYRTTNALSPYSGGLNTVVWSAPQPAMVPHDPYYGLVFKPGNSQIVYASGTTVERSTDNGVSWTDMAPPFAGPNVLRVALAATPANPDFLYAVVITKQPDPCNGPTFWVDANNVQHPINSSWLYRYDSSTQTWTDKGPICNTGSYGNDQRGVGVSHADSIGVSPIDPNLIYIGDVNPIAKCTTGGGPNFCSWIQTNNSAHADVHATTFSPDGATVYAATDGGMFKTTDGMNWTSQNNGLRVSTVDAMSTSATDPTLIMAGEFDTGTVVGHNTTWSYVPIGGDGREPIVDYSDPTHLYASAQGGYVVRSDNGGASFSNYVGLPSSTCSNWGTFYVLNSGNPLTVFAACNPEVLRSLNRGAGWTPISNFTGGGLGSYVTWKVYVAPSNPDYLYAYLVSPSTNLPGVLMRTTNANDANPANVSWQAIPHPVAQWIESIDVDESDPENFWMVYGGIYPPNTPVTQKVYYHDHANPSAPWHDLTGNLSNMGVNAIVHRRGTDEIYIGTTLGVYMTHTSALNWTRVGAATQGELPYVEVTKLEINYVNNTLRAATHGRGVWEIRLEPCPPPVAGPDAIIRDSDVDMGVEPDSVTGVVLYDSPEIWVRNQPDHRFTTAPVPPRYSHEEQHQNPEYSPLPINTPYVYAKVHNNGNAAVSGKVHLYFGNAATGLNWPSDWTEIVPQNPASTDVVNLAPGGDWVVNVQWTSIPPPPSPLDGHYCLLARFVADPSTPDPINGEVSNNGVWGNVFYSNNIAWKNVTIVDDFQNRDVSGPFGGGEVTIRNVLRTAISTRLRIDMTDGAREFLKSGAIEVELGDQLFAEWQKSAKKDAGLRAIGHTTLGVLEPHIVIDGLKLAPREEHLLTVRFRRGPGARNVPEFKLRLTQFDRADGAKGEMQPTGGETYIVRAMKP